MLMIRFCENGIKNGTLKDLFPLNQKSHDMKTRSMEKYKVTYAQEERLKTSLSWI